MIEEITDLLNNHDYDVRKTGDARFMDQKCTPDVVSIIADCVVNLTNNDPAISFTVRDIWDSSYFIQNVKAVFNKPDAKNQTTKSEYDKFIQQPLRLFAYAGILNINKSGRSNIYTVTAPRILEYISLKERNAFIFLYNYLIKVMTDSYMIRYFELFKNKHESKKLTQEDFLFLKNRYTKFIKGNTNIQRDFEIPRIFNKIINIYSTYNNLPGSERGKLTKHEYTFSDLMYNKKNWRDLNKGKNISRQENAVLNSETDNNDSAYDNYLVQKAIRTIKNLYLESEVNDQWANGEATQVHHIFPKSKFPQLSAYLENLIKLTPTQHYTKAHPSNRTDDINTDYQLTCLLAKCDSIEKSLKMGQYYYRKESFIHVINIGLNQQINSTILFGDIKIQLSRLYNYL